MQNDCLLFNVHFYIALIEHAENHVLLLLFLFFSPGVFLDKMYNA